MPCVAEQSVLDLLRGQLPADEIARAAVFLASDQASFVTGQILTADGGKTAG